VNMEHKEESLRIRGISYVMSYRDMPNIDVVLW
jgi:hypothetical protein